MYTHSNTNTSTQCVIATQYKLVLLGTAVSKLKAAASVCTVTQTLKGCVSELQGATDPNTHTHPIHSKPQK